MRIGEWAVAAAPARIVTIGLGSCVAIVLHDARARIGGLAHVLLPTPAVGQEAEFPGKFPCSAVPLVLGEMRALGANGAITARLVGGASLFGAILAREGAGGIGDRNIAASRTALAAARLRVVGELVGGEVGRSVYFDVGTGKVHVRSVRDGDRVL